MNTGHDGSMTTLHANSPVEALERLEILALRGSANVSSEVAKRQIISAVDMVIHINRFPDGSRRITQISEIIEAREYFLQDIFILTEEADQAQGLRLTGRAPTFYVKLKNRAKYSCSEFEYIK
jgi:pilus assembly protein CpaF